MHHILHRSQLKDKHNRVGLTYHCVHGSTFSASDRLDVARGSPLQEGGPSCRVSRDGLTDCAGVVVND